MVFLPFPLPHPPQKPSRLFRFPGAEITTFYISLALRAWSFHIYAHSIDVINGACWAIQPAREETSTVPPSIQTIPT